MLNIVCTKVAVFFVILWLSTCGQNSANFWFFGKINFRRPTALKKGQNGGIWLANGYPVYKALSKKFLDARRPGRQVDL